MNHCSYLMESDEEIFRLELKTEGEAVERQARWAGLQPGMRVADFGCGSGKTSFHLHNIVGPKGQVIGVDSSEERIIYAKKTYSDSTLDYVCRDFSLEMNDLGTFDFIWVRFVLEYYKSDSFRLAEKFSKLLRPGGILCLIDLDYNCMTHFGLPVRLEKAICKIVGALEETMNFDPYVGRKIYSYFYDLDFDNIKVQIFPHHLIFGELQEKDSYNWQKKLEIAATRAKCNLEEYPGGFEEFFEEFKRTFADPRRFSYTPAIMCRGERRNV